MYICGIHDCGIIVATGARANVTQCENEIIEWDSVRVSRARQCGSETTWGRGGLWQTARAWVITIGWINGWMRLVKCDGLNATQWLRRGLTGSGHQALQYDSSLSRCHSWKPIRPYIWAHHRVRLTQWVSFSKSSSHGKHMPWRIWLLHNNYDCSLYIIIPTINHYSCWTITW